MAHARKRLPIEANAKCSGTRSGVSITSVSSVGIAADISTQNHFNLTNLPHLAGQLSALRVNDDFGVRGAREGVKSGALDRGDQFGVEAARARAAFFAAR